MLALHDTATGAVAEIEPRAPGTLSMYVCGPTVYGPPHIGHGRMALTFDVLRRYLTWSGLEVRHVSNVTDIDDKIINLANEQRRDWRELAADCEELWWSAMAGIGVAKPDVVPHATAYVDEMIELISDLIERGAAYQTSDGVYLSIASVPGYGLLAHQSLDSLRVGARVEVNEEKHSPLDFALWKAARPGEPSWEAPFGEGRPGWHTECVVMSLALLGEGFDLHGGGQDLMFPHHENERAQAVAWGRRFARRWMHNGMVTVGGEKMSKSLGNFTTLAEVLERFDGRAFRLLGLRAHYRSPMEVTADALQDATTALQRVDTLARRFPEASVGEHPLAVELLARFREAMDDDLDTPGAMAVLFDGLRRANSCADDGDEAAGAALAGAVLDGLGAVGLVAARGDEEVEAWVTQKIAERDDARARRDYAEADRLRQQLEAAGYVVEDTPNGTKVHRQG